MTTREAQSTDTGDSRVFRIVGQLLLSSCVSQNKIPSVMPLSVGKKYRTS